MKGCRNIMSGSKINLNGIDRLYEEYSWRLTRRAKKAWASGLVVGNKSHGETALLENAICKYTGRKFAIAVGSGTDALYFSLLAKGIGKGSVVGCPAVSYMATAEAIKRTGATIKFIDTDKNGGLGKIPKDIKALVYVNLFGIINDYDTIKDHCDKYKITLIEDAAQSLGSFYGRLASGKLGDVSALSFSPTKPLPAFGNAGMVLTDDQQIALQVQAMRYHSYNGVDLEFGYNSCIPESVAAQLNFLLGKYKSLLNKRRRLYKIYEKQLHDAPVVFLPIDKKVASNHSKLVLKVSNRDELIEYLATKGIESNAVYRKPLHQMKMFSQNPYDASWSSVYCTQAESFCQRTIGLPIHPFLRKDEVLLVCKHIREFYGV